MNECLNITQGLTYVIAFLGILAIVLLFALLIRGIAHTEAQHDNQGKKEN